VADEEPWLRRHWSTLAALLVVFGIAMFLRTYFVYGAAIPDRLYSGGSDSFYHDAIIRHAYATGHQLTFDPLLNYPLGLTNPRPPLFQWWTLLSGYVISPAFPSAWSAITYSFILTTALFGSLTVFPLYALVKEAFDRRAGLIAAFLLAVSPGHLQRSVASNADHDAFVLFFVVTGYFFFFRALATMNEKRWVESWKKPSAIRSGIALFFRENQVPVLYSLLASFCIAAVALTWQGWAYAPIILLVYFVFQLFFHRIRNKDTLGITVAFGITMGVALLVSAPWYVQMNQVKVWFDVPAYLFAAAIAFAVLFTVTRDLPWAIVIPTVLGLSAIALGIGAILNPALANAFVSGAGYFVQTKLYETIAEAQAPPLSQIILAFGWGTYFLSWGALGYLLWQFVTGRRTQTAYLFFVVWTLAAIIMAQAAARFIFNASPAFAASAGFAIGLIIQRLDFDGLKRTYTSVAAGSRRAAIRKSVKPRHVVGALLIVFLFFVPNVWHAVDASIPFEDKYAYDKQIYDLTPQFLRPANYASVTQGANPFYLGAFGFSLPHSKEYYPAAWEWFAAQDAELEVARRPAFLSWWDYGFEAVDKGAHPTVADNFQNGYHLAGNVIAAQSENTVIALLTLRLVEGDFWSHGRTLSPGVRAALIAYGIDPGAVQTAFRQPDLLVPTVKANPIRYGYYDDKLQAQNALYIYTSDLLTTTLGTDRQADLYRTVREVTGKNIGYFAVDSRLFPTSASNTGIFYAPLKLSDRRVLNLRDGRILPYDFLRIYVTLGGNRVPIESLGEFDRPDDADGEIVYKPMFYHSFFYRVYAGFAPSEIGREDDGVPGLSGTNAQTLSPLPAWGLTHWRVVYRTAYYNPFTDTTNHSGEWRAVNYFDALTIQQDIDAGTATGVVDLSPANAFRQGVIFARYYDGAFVNGTVTVAERDPVSGVHVTVTDELGVPHYEATTDAAGAYSVLAPFGAVRVTFSTGALDPLTRVGATVLESVPLTVTDDAAQRRPVDADGDGIVDWRITRDIVLAGATVNGRVYVDMNANNAFDAGQDLPLAGAGVRIHNRDLGIENATVADGAGRYTIHDVYRGPTYVNVTAAGRTIPSGPHDIPVTDTTIDIPVTGLLVNGNVKDAAGNVVPGAEVRVVDRTNGTTLAVLADEAGAYSFRGLLAGEFEVSATAGDLATLPALLSIGPIGRLGFNLTAYPSGTLQGRTFVGGNLQGFTTVEFANVGNPSLARTVTSDVSGGFTVVLPSGRYSVTGRQYLGTRLFAILDAVDVTRGATSPYDARLADGAEVRGTVYSGTVTNVSRAATVTFRSGTGDVYRTRTSNFGVYIAWIPQGTYDVQAIQGANAYVDRRAFTGFTTLDIPLSFRSLYTGFVYRDLNRNGVREAQEGVGGARVTFVDPAARVLTLVTPANGSFIAPLEASLRYTMTIDAHGFQPRSLGPSTVAELRGTPAISMVPLNITVSGVLRWNGSPLTGRGISLLFRGLDGGAVTADTAADLQGAFTIALAPGRYDVIVDENVSAASDGVRWQTKARDPLTLDVGAPPVVHDVDVVQRARVTGDVTLFGTPISAPVTFEGPDNLVVEATNGRFQTYLALGDYTVYANRSQGSQTVLYAAPVTISGPANLAIPLAPAKTVSGRVTVDGATSPEPITVTFTRAQGGTFRGLTDPTGSYRVSVPDGDFSVTVDARTTMTVSGAQRFVRIRFTGSLAVPASATAVPFDIHATRTLDNSTVTGRVTSGRTGVAATITFSVRAGGAMNATAVAASDGTYGVALQPGTYNVHAVASGGLAAFLGTLVVAQGADASVNLSLVPAFPVTGVTTLPGGARVSADLTFSGPADVHVASDGIGVYRVVLPLATYAVTARTSRVENGIAVSYAKPATLVLSGPPDPLNLALDRLVQRGVKLTWDSTQRLTVPAGASVTYTIVITNTGNVADEYTFATLPAGWTFEFRPARPRLDFGTAGNTTTVDVTITTPRDALVEHGDVTITARPVADSSVTGNVVVQVGILPRRALALAVASAIPTFDGRYLNYSIAVSNRGNMKEILALTLPTLSELAARGWIARFAPPAGGSVLPEIRNLSVDGNTTRTVTLSFENRGGGAGATAAVAAFAEDLPGLRASLTFQLSLPVLTPGGDIDASGPNIVTTQDLPYPLIAVLVTIIACVSAGFLLTKRRRR